MKRVMLVSGVLYGCLGPVVEGLDPLPSAIGSDEVITLHPDCGESFVMGIGCGPSEPGDPRHIMHTGLCARHKPTCDVEAMNRPSQSPAEPGQGVDAPSPELKSVAQLMVGQWHGTQTTPWDGTHQVLLTFFENGRYSGTSLGENSVLFYYGESCAYHRESWRLESGTSALAGGHIQTSQDFPPVCMTEELRSIQVDADSLRFELWHLDAYGPITLELQRTW